MWAAKKLGWYAALLIAAAVGVEAALWLAPSTVDAVPGAGPEADTPPAWEPAPPSLAAVQLRPLDASELPAGFRPAENLR
jgi:hypothetical protein